MSYTGDGKTSYVASRTCNCGDTQTATAKISFEDTQDATCTVTGVKTYTATFGVDWAEQKITTEEIPARGHQMTLTPETEHNQMQLGNTAYYTCSRCEKYFSDENGDNEIENGSWIINHEDNGHGYCELCGILLCQHDGTIVQGSAQEQTCTQDGWAAYEYCTKCDYTTKVVIPAGHNYGDLIPASSEKHTQDELAAAVAAHYQCSVCQKYFTESKVETTLAELTGKAPTHNYSDATCTALATCSCGKTTGAVNPNNHVNKTPHAQQDATCTAGGFTAGTYCEDCDKWISGHEEIPAGHNYGDLIPASSEKHTQDELAAAVAAHYQCSVCQKYFTESKVETTLEALTGETPEHSYSDATCTAPKTCTVCNVTDGEALGHAYDNNTDATCNRCEYVRDLACVHVYDEDGYDEAYRWKQCSKCQAVDESTKVARKYTVTFQGFAEGKDITLQGSYGINDTITVPTLKSFYFEFNGNWTVGGQVLVPDSKVELRALESLIGEEDTIYVEGSYAITGLKPDAVMMNMQYGDATDGEENEDVFMTISIFVTVDKGMTPIVSIGGENVEGERVGTLDVYYYQIPLTMDQIMDTSYALTIKVEYVGSNYSQELTVSIAEYIRALTDMFGEEGVVKTEELFAATRNYIEALQNYNAYKNGATDKAPSSAPYFSIDEKNKDLYYSGEATLNGDGTAIAAFDQANVTFKNNTYSLGYRLLINLPDGITPDYVRLILTDEEDALDRSQKWDRTTGSDYEYKHNDGHNEVWIENVPASEMAVRYATIYVEYRDADGEHFAYSQTLKYGVITYLNRQINELQYGEYVEEYPKNKEMWMITTMFDALRTLAGLADPLSFDDSANAPEIDDSGSNDVTNTPEAGDATD